jgi:hypothetical protein
MMLYPSYDTVASFTFKGLVNSDVYAFDVNDPLGILSKKAPPKNVWAVSVPHRGKSDDIFYA